MIAFEDNSERPDWSVGQVVLGGSKWKCTWENHNQTKSGIYAKIKQIIYPKDDRIDLVTDDVRFVKHTL